MPAEVKALPTNELATLTVLYTDMVNSSEYGRRHGARVLRFKQGELNQLVIPLLEEHGGTRIRLIGDAVQFTFEYPKVAVEAAVAALVAAERYNLHHDGEVREHEIHIRIGIDHGRTLFNEQFGQTELVGN